LKRTDDFGARTELKSAAGKVSIYRLQKLEEDGVGKVSRLPFSIKVLLEALLRNCDDQLIKRDDLAALANWNPKPSVGRELAFLPARVLLQDFTGVPTVVDLAAMRSALARLGGDPKRINPSIPVDLVIDHSVQVDQFGSQMALAFNAEREFERNRERYEFLRWGQKAFENFRVVPPATGIVHQVNLEYLAKVVQIRNEGREAVAFPDTLVGTDSHTTMVNGLGVLGWGVGGIEAEAVMLGQPIYLLAPKVVGFRLHGQLREGVTATDLVLTATQMLRKHGVVEAFVEYFGPGLSYLSLPDRATLANMSPEYGATIGFFPVDAETLSYLRGTGRDPALIDLVERYCKEQGLFRTDESPDPLFSETLELDLGTVESSVAGPKRPQDRVPISQLKKTFQAALRAPVSERGFAVDETALTREAPIRRNGNEKLHHGSVVIAAITSCTNTSNPSVMIGAALLAKKAVERGMKMPSYVKTSLAPGSKVVQSYLEAAGLLHYLEELRFNIVGFGCTTCIGNSGPVPEPVAQAVREGDLVAVAVLSGNRNFEGRINPLTKASYLASPPLVVAYALAGRVDIDLDREPLGQDRDGKPVFLGDIWPTQKEIQTEISRSLKPEMFKSQYANVFDGNEQWNQIPVPEGDLYRWNARSTYIQEPSFFSDMTPEPQPLEAIRGARVLAIVGDSVTTDHISPAGFIAEESPAGRFLIGRGLTRKDFNSYGSRRGNHEVMMRGTFANIRLKNLLAPGTEGGVTIHLPTGETVSIYDAATRYQQEKTPLLILAGKDYGMGSSRDWAAKGPMLLGVKAVIAESYERIHRSNLVGMGILPLQFKEGESVRSLGLTGHEIFEIEGIDTIQPGQELRVRARRADGSELAFETIARIDLPIEHDYYRNGGILQTVLRKLLAS
jgi:aconitate hydratase